MCIIDPVIMEYYEDGKVPLGKEFNCHSCEESGVTDVWKGRQPICPYCGSPDITLGGTHLPDTAIVFVRESQNLYSAVCQNPYLEVKSHSRKEAIERLREKIIEAKPGKEIVILDIPKK